MLRTFVQFFCIVFGINAVWEVVQTPLYNHAHMFGVVVPSSLFNPTYDAILLYATLGDVLYIALIYVLVACIEHNTLWVRRWHARDTFLVIGAGLAFATAIEWRGLELGYWSYSGLMPIVPLVQVGLSPFLQLSITALASFYVLKYTVRAA